MTDSSDEETLNVLMLAEDFYPKESGGAFIDWNLAQYLADCGDSVTVVTPRNGPNPSVEHVDGVEIRRPFRSYGPDTHPNSIRGFLWRVLYVIGFFPYISFLIINRQFGIIYSTNHLFHFPAALLSTVFGCAHVSFVGFSPSVGPDPSIMNPFVLLERLNFRFFMGDKALCRTPSVADLIMRLSNTPVEQIDGIVDPDAVRNAVRSEKEEQCLSEGCETTFELISVGRLVDIKNPTGLVQLIDRLPPEYSLMMIGDGPSRSKVERSIRDSGASDRITLVGRMSHQETLKAIYAADLLLLPSNVEAYPTVVFEALSLNTPVLATPVGVLTNIDHPRLTTAPLADFDDVLSTIDLDTQNGIDEDTLGRYSVDRFARDARSHLRSATPW